MTTPCPPDLDILIHKINLPNMSILHSHRLTEKFHILVGKNVSRLEMDWYLFTEGACHKGQDQRFESVFLKVYLEVLKKKNIRIRQSEAEEVGFKKHTWTY